MTTSYAIRSDGRSGPVYGKNMKQFTTLENLWSAVFAAHQTSLGVECETIENGVDNTGEVIYGAVGDAVDKVFVLDGVRVPVDVKTVPVKNLGGYMTFKVSSLNSGIRQGASFLVPYEDRYYLFNTDGLRRISAEGVGGRWDDFANRKPARRIFWEAVEDMVASGECEVGFWSPEALGIIADNREMIHAKKAVDQ